MTLVVPFAAGTVADGYARSLADALARRLGQPVVIDNVPGAGGNVGVERVVRARPDGYTAVLAGDAALVVNPALAERMPYDTLRDLAPISQLFANPTVLVTAVIGPVQSVAGLIELARVRPGEVSFASAGSGTSSHRAGQMLRSAARVDLLHVPYTTSPSVDVMEGRVTVFFAPLTALQHVRAGRLRALAVTSSERVALAPEVPTMIELGFAGFHVEAWFGLLAPAATPPPVIQRLHQDATAAVRTPEVQQRLTEAGAQIIASTPESFRATLIAELQRWQQVLRSAR